MIVNSLVWHDHKEPFRSIFVCLELIVGTAYAGSASQEQQQLRPSVWVVGGLRDIDLNIIEFCNLLLFLS